MKILFFGSLIEKTGTTELVIPPANTLAALKASILKTYPALGNSVYAIAVNETIIAGDIALKENDVIALMPPFSGG